MKGLLVLLFLGAVVAVCLSAPVSEECVYNGVTYHAGDSFKSSDGCNTCGCGGNNAVFSSGQTCNYNGQVYNNGDSFKDKDDCNTCWCSDGMVACTEMACLKMPFEG